MADGSEPGEKYEEPQLAINRVYTKKGDSGKTALVGGQRVDKDDVRIAAYGTVDELNAFIGAARQSLVEGAAHTASLAELAGVLLRIQHELFNAGSILATLPEDVGSAQPRVSERDVEALERDIDQRNLQLAPLRSFVLPGACRLNVELHQARTVCRRAERLCVTLAREGQLDPLVVTYLNRLSDALFVWSRWVVAQLGLEETLWQPNQGASGASEQS